MFFDSSKLLVFTILVSLCYSIPVKQSSEEISEHNNDEFPVNIIGGRKSNIGRHPYQVALFVETYFVGAGVIIDHSTVVTLASLVDGEPPKNITISAGSTNYDEGRVYGVKEVKIHEKFDPYTSDHDIAVLKLNETIRYGKTVKPIAIATKRLSVGSSVTVSGWGFPSASKNNYPYKEATQEIISLNSCKKRLSQFAITNTMVCAFKKGSGPCWFDFGNVIVSKNKAYGIFSWSKSCNVTTDPSVYTDLTVFRKWIKSTTSPSKLALQSSVEVPKNEGIHALYKRNADYNDKINEDEMIEKAIEEEEAEEALAEEEEIEQEKQEDIAEKEAVEMAEGLDNIEEKVDEENIRSEEDDEAEARKEEEEQEAEEDKEEEEVNDIVDKFKMNHSDELFDELDRNTEDEDDEENKYHHIERRDIQKEDKTKGSNGKSLKIKLLNKKISAHIISKRSPISFVDYSQDKNGNSNHDLELAIEEEEIEEAQASELEKEQEAEENIEEEEAVEAVADGNDEELDEAEEADDKEVDTNDDGDEDLNAEGVNKDAEDEKEKDEADEDENNDNEDFDNGKNRKNKPKGEDEDDNEADDEDDDVDRFPEGLQIEADEDEEESEREFEGIDEENTF